MEYTIIFTAVSLGLVVFFWVLWVKDKEKPDG